MRAAIDASYLSIECSRTGPSICSANNFSLGSWNKAVVAALHYAFVMSGSFLVAAFEAWRIQLGGGPVNLSLVLAVCSFMGGALAESTAGRMRRF